MIFLLSINHVFLFASGKILTKKTIDLMALHYHGIRKLFSDMHACIHSTHERQRPYYLDKMKLFSLARTNTCIYRFGRS